MMSAPLVDGTTPAPRTRSRAVGAYFWSRLQHRRLMRLQASVFTGFWLGALSPAELEELDDTFYVGDGSGRRSPIDYTAYDYNRQGLFEWERRAMDAHFAGVRSIALMAAGGGREALALARDGLRIQAWECQPRFVDAANELLVGEGFDPVVTHAPRNDVPPTVGPVDGAIIGWGAYSLIPTRERRVAVLAALRARLEPGAPLLVSVLMRSTSDAQFRLIATVANTVRLVQRRARVEIGDVLQPNLLHLFVEDELREELGAGGFEPLWIAREPYGHAVAVAGES